MFKNLILSLERIQYQPASSLFSAITTLCQTAIDAIEYDNEISQLHGDALQEKVAFILNRIDFTRKLIAVIHAELNIKLQHAGIVRCSDPNALATMEFNIKLVSDKPKAKKTPRAPNASLLKQIKMIDSIVHNHDPITGVVKETIDNFYMSAIYITTGLFTVEYVKPLAEALTAANVAATILHEIGHIVTTLDLFAEAYSKAEKLNDLVKSITENTTSVDTVAFANALHAEVEKLQDCDNKQKLLWILHIVQKSKELTHNEVVGLYILSLLLLVWVNVFYATDVLATDPSHIPDMERRADEFVDLHGATAAQTAGHIKMQTFDETPSKRVTQWMQANSALNFLLGKYMLATNVIGYFSAFNREFYDPIVRRLQVFTNNAQQELKDQTLPSDIRDVLIDNIQTARHAIADYEKRDYVKLREQLWGSLLRISRPGTTWKALQNGNLSADYQRLQEATKDLIQSPLAYHAARLSRLAETTSETI